jgi:hypothetical protein
MSKKLQLLLEAATEILESGDDEGCEGLVVVTNDAYRRLQVVVQSIVKTTHGIEVCGIGLGIFGTTELRRFLKAEIANESNGGVSPTTLESALDSLDQMPPDVLGDLVSGVSGTALAVELKALIEEHGSDLVVAGQIEP